MFLPSIIYAKEPHPDSINGRRKYRLLPFNFHSSSSKHTVGSDVHGNTTSVTKAESKARTEPLAIATQDSKKRICIHDVA